MGCEGFVAVFVAIAIVIVIAVAVAGDDGLAGDPHRDTDSMAWCMDAPETLPGSSSAVTLLHHKSRPFGILCTAQDSSGMDRGRSNILLQRQGRNLPGPSSTVAGRPSPKRDSERFRCHLRELSRLGTRKSLTSPRCMDCR